MDHEALMLQLKQQQEQSNRLQEEKLQHLMHSLASKMERLVARCVAAPPPEASMDVGQPLCMQHTCIVAMHVCCFKALK